MNQQNGMQLPKLPDADWAYTVLSDLKRVVREYATAATESTCPDVRSMFTDLMNSSLKMQGDLYNAMQSANMYDTSSPVLRQEIQKQIGTYTQTQQQTQQFIQQRMSGMNSGQAQPFMGQNQQQPQSPMYN
ncbi:spore coat protein [Paenibacillus pasadenensis]|uniref:spore coat protein n=1 Tax=Paenibacillus pasadenensis TaxID=217090 RepID=UPI00204132FE|nr:spore coat protein [Paenibacillus pasadenensis]MCM3746815.1 spore coat protein [Paenibacillus pasadenensis]